MSTEKENGGTSATEGTQNSAGTETSGTTPSVETGDAVKGSEPTPASAPAEGDKAESKPAAETASTEGSKPAADAKPEEAQVTLTFTGDVSKSQSFPVSTTLADAAKKLGVPAGSQLRAASGVIDNDKLPLAQLGRGSDGTISIGVSKKAKGG